MRRWLVALVAVLAAAAVSFGIVSVGAGTDEAAASYGDRRTCVTPREARAIELGMTSGRVKRIVDSKGWVVQRSNEDGFRFVEREYKACWSKQRDVHVFYVNNRVYGMALGSGWWR
jgi:hypothetical protein